MTKKTLADKKETGGLFGLLLSALLYTALGLLGALLYSFAIAPTLHLPFVSLGTLIAIWWLWFLIFMPPIILFISTFSAVMKKEEDNKSD